MIYLSNYQFKELQSHFDAVQKDLNAIRAIFLQAKQQVSIPSFDQSGQLPPRPMTKKQLASMLGISSRYLASQIALLRPELRNLGVSDRARLLPPKAVLLICSALDIEKNDTVNCNKLQTPA